MDLQDNSDERGLSQMIFYYKIYNKMSFGPTLFSQIYPEGPLGKT